MLKKAQRILTGLRIDSNASEKLMDIYGPFAATERLMMEAVKRGGDRQVLHEVIESMLYIVGRNSPPVVPICLRPHLQKTNG